MVVKDLSVDMEYVKKNKDRLLQEYRNKFILVHNGEFISSFDNYPAAAQEAIRLYGKDTAFLIEQLTDVKPINIVMAAAL